MTSDFDRMDKWAQSIDFDGLTQEEIDWLWDDVENECCETEED